MFANVVKVAGAVAAVATTVGISATISQAQLSGLIQIDGSSTVYPVTEAMAEDFRAVAPNVDITVGVSGTSGGFRKFCAGETDISNASRAIKSSEVEACAAAGVEYVEFLVAIDALAIVVDKDNTFAYNITEEELTKMWEPAAQGVITRWNQVNPSWPNQPLRLFGAGTDSGTFDYFTEHLMGTVGASRADYTASEDDNILVLGVSRDPSALGYFGLAYYEENASELRILTVNGVEATPANATSGEYPLARPLYVYVAKPALRRPEVRAFMEFYLNQARNTNIILEVGYVPVSTEEYDEAISKL
jgi:phosphate transport system substrate-binding protein